VQLLRHQAQESLKSHIQNKLPEEYERCMTGMNQVLGLSWDIANKPKDGNDNGQTMTMTDDKTRLQALSLINDCYKYIMDLTTNGVVITDAIKYVQSQLDNRSMTEKSLLQDIKDKEKENTDIQKTHNGGFLAHVLNLVFCGELLKNEKVWYM
jgi:hypothetical protein